MEKNKKKNFMSGILFCVTGILINMAGIALAKGTHIPLFLDTVGTVLTAVMGGYLPGIIVATATNLFKGVLDSSAMYYGILDTLIAVGASFFFKKGYLGKIGKTILVIFILALIHGGLGALLTWALFGFAGNGVSSGFAEQIYATGFFGKMQAQFFVDFLVDFVDKAIAIGFTILMMKFLPADLQKRVQFASWQQNPLSEEMKQRARESECRSVSLRTKMLFVLVLAALAIAATATGLSYMLFRNATIDDHKKLAEGAASVASAVIDGNKVNDFIEKGQHAEEYTETETRLKNLLTSSDDIQYVYAYKIMEDGCHVVFDLDSGGEVGSEPGEVIPFDDAFRPLLDDLLAGREIEPIISDETYGWLMTVYKPVYDSHGVCQCYAAIDVSMTQLRDNVYHFFVRLVALFFCFFILILAIGLWLAEYNIILPINTMALSASAFAYNSEEARENSVERIRELGIQTGDEVENLYRAFLKTTEDSVQYVEDLQNKTETISQMQNGLILVLADIVESRDQCTGDHVRKTAAYTKIVMEEMRKKGYYADVLTDEFISDVVNSAPLHDIGKIHVPDAILNKPGRLTDDEFEIMKEHTTAGQEIIESAIKLVPESGYLSEAKNLATYHHEKWNGTGYPTGISGEDIPLSARIMAVADVFDALVSRRSYKKPFTFEKAMDIIREGAGSHFDPKVADAFLGAADEVKKVAQEFGELEEE